MSLLIQPALPPKYAPSSTTLHPPHRGHYCLSAQPFFHLLSFQQPERLFLCLMISDLVTPLLQTLPKAPISQSESQSLWWAQDPPSSIPTHTPVPPATLPQSLLLTPLLTALISRACNKHFHLRGFIFCVFSTCNLHSQMSGRATPNSSILLFLFFNSDIAFLYCMFSLQHNHILHKLPVYFAHHVPPQRDVSSMGTVNFDYFVHCWVPATRTASH